jgi:DNA-binding CsgD family transcriptional regulator
VNQSKPRPWTATETNAFQKAVAYLKKKRPRSTDDERLDAVTSAFAEIRDKPDVQDFAALLCTVAERRLLDTIKKPKLTTFGGDVPTNDNGNRRNTPVYEIAANRPGLADTYNEMHGRPAHEFTDMQRAVAAGHHAGKTNKQIARELGISPQQVGQVLKEVFGVARAKHEPWMEEARERTQALNTALAKPESERTEYENHLIEMYGPDDDYDEAA